MVRPGPEKEHPEAGLDSRDAALATRLCFGVLQNKLLCDFYIGKFSTVKVERLENRVLNALRLGIYQMAFLTKIPASAAVNESVELARKYSKNPAAQVWSTVSCGRRPVIWNGFPSSPGGPDPIPVHPVQPSPLAGTHIPVHAWVGGNRTPPGG